MWMAYEEHLAQKEWGKKALKIIFENMNKSTKTKKSSKSPYSTTVASLNISKLTNGMYRARKCIDGVKYSRNFPLLRDAKAWRDSF
jgi:restriction endonuclease S subunit